jgi:hypothetical protein
LRLRLAVESLEERHLPTTLIPVYHPAVNHPAVYHPAVNHPAVNHQAVYHPAHLVNGVMNGAYTDAAYTEPAYTEPAYTEAAYTEPAYTEMVPAPEPAKATPAVAPTVVAPPPVLPAAQVVKPAATTTSALPATPAIKPAAVSSPAQPVTQASKQPAAPAPVLPAAQVTKPATAVAPAQPTGTFDPMTGIQYPIQLPTGWETFLGSKVVGLTTVPANWGASQPTVGFGLVQVPASWQMIGAGEQLARQQALAQLLNPTLLIQGPQGNLALGAPNWYTDLVPGPNGWLSVPKKNILQGLQNGTIKTGADLAAVMQANFKDWMKTRSTPQAVVDSVRREAPPVPVLAVNDIPPGTPVAHVEASPDYVRMMLMLAGGVDHGSTGAPAAPAAPNPDPLEIGKLFKVTEDAQKAAAAASTPDVQNDTNQAPDAGPPAPVKGDQGQAESNAQATDKPVKPATKPAPAPDAEFIAPVAPLPAETKTPASAPPPVTSVSASEPPVVPLLAKAEKYTGPVDGTAGPMQELPGVNPGLADKAMADFLNAHGGSIPIDQQGQAEFRRLQDAIRAEQAQGAAATTGSSRPGFLQGYVEITQQTPPTPASAAARVTPAYGTPAIPPVVPEPFPVAEPGSIWDPQAHRSLPEELARVGNLPSDTINAVANAVTQVGTFYAQPRDTQTKQIDAGTQEFLNNSQAGWNIIFTNPGQALNTVLNGASQVSNNGAQIGAGLAGDAALKVVAPGAAGAVKQVQGASPLPRPFAEPPAPVTLKVTATASAARTTTGGTLKAAVAQNVRDAQASGLVARENVVALQPHSAAPAVRAAQGVTGAEIQSAHVLPQSFGENIAGYSAGQAQTLLLPTAAHTALDASWKDWAQGLRRLGKTDVSAGELYQAVATAIEKAPGLSAQTQGALKWRLFDEMFKDLKLQWGDRIPLPYPNIKPAPR